MTTGAKPASSSSSSKPGWKTTEGWATGAVIAGTVAASLAGSLPGKYAAISSALASGLYAIGRGLAKGGSGGTE